MSLAHAPEYHQVVTWQTADRTRLILVPCDHRLEIIHSTPFDATIVTSGSNASRQARSTFDGERHRALFRPPWVNGDAKLILSPEGEDLVSGGIRFLTYPPTVQSPYVKEGLVLLTNGRGAMAQMRVDLGAIHSKYDCVLGANLHPTLPIDRHVFVKRVRAWLRLGEVVIAQLGKAHVVAFEAGPPAVWKFAIPCLGGATARLDLVADMIEDKNTTVLRFMRPAEAREDELPTEADMRLTLRVDIEDRNFHQETKNVGGGADFHFSSNSHPMAERTGFAFTPAPDRQLRVMADSGIYHHQGEWSASIAHPIEQSRGQEGSGDAYSPGWFDLAFAPGQIIHLILTAETEPPTRVATFIASREQANLLTLRRANMPESDQFERQLVLAARQFVVRREHGYSVIAGYPWFKDWGRDSLISARGLVAAGFVEEVHSILKLFGRYEDRGTLPNIIHGDNVSNRDTVDAPLWYSLACDETAQVLGQTLYDSSVDPSGRTIADVLLDIATHYIQGTPNGIHMDPQSALIWSPAHFTWMDTNYPACSPRQGYPVEIQVLWIRHLRHLDSLGLHSSGETWASLAQRASDALEQLYWLQNPGAGIAYLADTLVADARCPASRDQADDALRSNCLLAVALDLLKGEKARHCVEAARRYLVVPGGLRSLAPLPVVRPLPIYGQHGGLLNDPYHPYWPRYEGDEDTRRKPAYHNGTAWTWTFPTFCEALAKAWGFSPNAVGAAKTYLGSMGRLLSENCVGQLPEILDGDEPHWQRGCSAQSWGVTETLRVWRLLGAGSKTEALSRGSA